MPDGIKVGLMDAVQITNAPEYKNDIKPDESQREIVDLAEDSTPKAVQTETKIVNEELERVIDEIPNAEEIKALSDKIKGKGWQEGPYSDEHNLTMGFGLAKKGDVHVSILEKNTSTVDWGVDFSLTGDIQFNFFSSDQRVIYTPADKLMRLSNIDKDSGNAGEPMVLSEEDTIDTALLINSIFAHVDRTTWPTQAPVTAA